MRQILLISVFIWSSINLLGQTTYVGFIDKYPVELLTRINADGNTTAVYCYTSFDEPIVIDGNLKNGKLILFEKDRNDKKTASFQFENFNSKNNKLEGVWTDLKTQKQLAVILNKSFDIDNGDSIEWSDREIIQSVSLNDKYFKLVVSKTKENFYAKVTGVKIYEKKTDKLLCKLPQK